MLERRAIGGSDKVDGHEELLCCSALKFVRILVFLYSITGSVRLGFFTARGADEGLYSFPEFHDEYLISGIDMIIIAFIVSMFLCCQSRAMFTVAVGLMVAVFVGTIVAIAMNFDLLVNFRDEDDYKLHVIRAFVPFSLFLHILLTLAMTKLSCIGGFGRNA